MICKVGHFCLCKEAFCESLKIRLLSDSTQDLVKSQIIMYSYLRKVSAPSYLHILCAQKTWFIPKNRYPLRTVIYILLTTLCEHFIRNFEKLNQYSVDPHTVTNSISPSLAHILSLSFLLVITLLTQLNFFRFLLPKRSELLLLTGSYIVEEVLVVLKLHFWGPCLEIREY